jgi:hypothetical protein
MFVGHYAAAVALTSVRPHRGVLTYVAFSAVLPDLLMLGTAPIGGSLNYHADLGLLLGAGVVLAIGIVFRFGHFSIRLALAGLLSHLPLDLLYAARDQSNLYAHPWFDFTLEAGLLLGAAAVFLMRSRRAARRRAYFMGVIAALLVLQRTWDFGRRFLATG